ncbi:unnamed protein product [Spirodela intermedia]|uniref:Glutamate carboxypeptidase 2 n=1 Tax=Spirodela intermedia TaxID=51605 RepID=A0ABN7EDL7_SPIIN|nr:unnamed protein product [Spirodela intermedia]
MGGPPLPEEWRRHLPRGMQVGGVGGVGGGSVLVNFTYEGVSEMETIRNVVGVITGELEPDRYVLLGNHRDAWTYGAVARRLGLLLREGWRPRRTIVLCSWDAEEFGMIGSTEWVEEHLGLLQSKAVAYLNVDCAVQGPGFFASELPSWTGFWSASQRSELMFQVKDPDFDSMTVYQTWTEANGRAEVRSQSSFPGQAALFFIRHLLWLGRADSDFTSFLHHAGVPSLDMYFGKDYPVYHTVFDSYDWMKKHGDPSFHRHVAVAEIWGLVALHLADDQIIPFDYLSYAARLQEHSSAMSSLLGDAVTMQPMNASLCELVASASEAKEEGQLRRRALNDRLMLAERGFLAAEGLRGRPWFKHLVR